jgi:integrase
VVYKQKKSRNWWYRFSWKGEIIRESTKQENKRVAQQIESARKTQLAEQEVGIKEFEAAPTLASFFEKDFLPFVESRSKDKPNTVRFYKNSVKNLVSYSKLGGAPLDEINSDLIAKYIAFRRRAEVEVSTINRELATLRRAFHLAQEWAKVQTLLPKVKMLPGENRREQLVAPEDEAKYLAAAAPLLRDAATILIDCALRPEECLRLRWEQVRDGAIEIFRGKARGSRRRVPCSERVLAAIEARRGNGSEWVFPRAHEVRPHRGVEPQEAARQRHRGIEGAALRAIRSPPYVHHALVSPHGPLHPARDRRPRRHEHDQAVRPPERRGRSAGDGEGSGRAYSCAYRRRSASEGVI